MSSCGCKGEDKKWLNPADDELVGVGSVADQRMRLIIKLIM